MKNLLEILRTEGKPKVFGALDILKNIGPGLLVTVGFIDPGNWASNFAAGSTFGYALLWVVTLSTIMLITLQHNVSHLGIFTGLCLSEATEKYAPKWIGRPILVTAFLASISTSLAEILGAAIALQIPASVAHVFEEGDGRLREPCLHEVEPVFLGRIGQLAECLVARGIRRWMKK